MSLAQADESIMSDADTILKRIIQTADGELAAITPAGVRIYSKPPDLTSIRYVMDRTLGAPGVRIHELQRNVDKRLWQALHEIYISLGGKGGDEGKEGADGNNGAEKILAPDGTVMNFMTGWIGRRQRLAAVKKQLEESVIEYLPTCIDRLAELCSGVTVRTTKTRKPRASEKDNTPETIAITTDTLRKPDRCAITYLLNRFGTDNKSPSAIPKIDTAIPQTQPVNRSEPTTIKVAGVPITDPDQLPAWVRQVMFNREEKLHKTRIPVADLFNGDGELRPNPVIDLPTHYIEAWKRLSNCVQPAIENLKSLAEGAKTRVTINFHSGGGNGSGESGNSGDYHADTKTIDITHQPDPAANRILLNRLFAGTKSRFTVTWNSIYDTPRYGQRAEGLRNNLIERCGTRAKEMVSLLDQLRTGLEQINPQRTSAF